MMDLLQGMIVFTRIVDMSSFSKAANLLEMPRGSVSTIMQGLETHLGVRLLNRTTRSVQVTEDGALYYEYCRRIIADVSDAEAALSNKRQMLRGTVRVDTTPALASNLLIPALTDFQSQYPEIKLKLRLADRLVDLIQDGPDCVLRIGALTDSTVIARSIGSLRMTTCAAPSYIASMGRPIEPSDLANHRAINYFSAQSGRIFPFEFEINGTVEPMLLDSALDVDDGQAYVAAATAGLGIVQSPRFIVKRAIEAGSLVEILQDYPCPASPLSLVYPHRWYSTRVRAFSEWVTALVAKDPDLRL